MRVKDALNSVQVSATIFAHGDDIVHISSPDFPSGKEGDALITDLENITLMITHADCQALILYDPDRPAIACIHSGWKGNTLNIYHKTVEAMVEKFQTAPKKLIACMSPSLGPRHSYFENYEKEFPELYWKYKDSENRIDLWKLAKDQLIGAGILESNIHLSGICSWEDENFFSHRKERPTGRNATLVCLNRKKT